MAMVVIPNIKQNSRKEKMIKSQNKSAKLTPATLTKLYDYFMGPQVENMGLHECTLMLYGKAIEKAQWIERSIILPLMAARIENTGFNVAPDQHWDTAMSCLRYFVSALLEDDVKYGELTLLENSKELLPQWLATLDAMSDERFFGIFIAMMLSSYANIPIEELLIVEEDK